MAESDDLLSDPEVQEILRLSRQTLYRLRRDGEIQSVLVRGALRYRRSDVDAYIASLSPTGGEAA